ncbi:MAG: hypothetical protein ABW043_16960 [Devosia sp.]|uniref:hypothetical protein n=1 Tax=Devosia sp. TaxID=1871048 RepID=UPI00339388A6
MDDIPEFVARAKAYCERAKISPSTLSRKLLGNGNRLSELESGKSYPRVDTWQKAKARLEQMERAA